MLVFLLDCYNSGLKGTENCEKRHLLLESQDKPPAFSASTMYVYFGLLLEVLQN